MKVYCIENKINGKKYIGVTRGEIIGRFKQHKKLTKSQHKCHLHNAMLSHGIDNFIVYEIDKADTKEELFEKEKHWIKTLDTKNNGYNETDGGEGSWGWKPTEEQRKNNSERIKKYYLNNPKAKEQLSNKSKEHWNKLSEEERNEKIEQFNKNKIGNQNAKNKTWKLSEETKRNMSDAKSKEWLIIFPNGKKEIIRNMRNFCKNNNLDQGALVNVSKGKNKHHKGYSCMKVGT